MGGFFCLLLLNRSMTYGELLEQLDNLEDDQLNHKVVAHIDEEFFNVKNVSVYDVKDSRLDDGCPYLEVD